MMYRFRCGAYLLCANLLQRPRFDNSLGEARDDQSRFSVSIEPPGERQGGHSPNGLVGKVPYVLLRLDPRSDHLGDLLDAAD